MVREIRRGSFWLALALAVAAVGPLEAQQRYRVLIPDLRPEGSADRKFGENVARELRTLIDDMNTHQAVAKRDIDQGFRRLRIDADRVDCAAAKQLATEMEYPLALCASYTQGAGGVTITAEFVDVRSGDALKVTPKSFPTSAASEAARHMFREFSGHVEEIRASAICADYVASEIWDQALEACGRAAQLNPRALGPRYQVAKVHIQTRKFPEALEALERVLEINPSHQDALQMAGYAASQLDDTQRALSYYSRYLEVAPGNAAVRTQVAYQLAQAGDPGAAVALIQKGVDNDPSNWSLWEQLGSYAFAAAAKANSARTDSATVAPESVPYFRKAIEAYERLFEAKGSEASSAHLRSVVSAYMILGEMDQAVAFGQRALQAVPEDPDLWWVQAEALYRAGRVPDALTALDRVTALRPNYPTAALRRGEWLLAAGRLNDAVTTLRALAASDPAQADAAGGLLVAQAYAKGVQPKRWNEAIPILEAARGIPGLSADTNHQINFWLAFSIMQGTIPLQEARTVETARATLPRFQRARELFDNVGDYPRKVRIDLATLIQTVDQYIQIQETIIRRGR